MSVYETALSTIIDNVITYLKKMSYSSSRIDQYRSAWKKLRIYMEKQSILEFNATVAESFIYDFLHGRSFGDLKRGERDIIQCVTMLTEFQEYGTIKYRRCHKFYELHGSIGKTMRLFLDHKKSYGIAQITIEEYKMVFQSFLVFLDSKNVKSIHQLSIQNLLQYCGQTGFCTPYVRHRDLQIVKRFLRFLYEQSIVEIDFSQYIPKVHYVKQPKLP